MPSQSAQPEWAAGSALPAQLTIDLHLCNIFHSEQQKLPGVPTEALDSNLPCTLCHRQPTSGHFALCTLLTARWCLKRAFPDLSKACSVSNSLPCTKQAPTECGSISHTSRVDSKQPPHGRRTMLTTVGWTLASHMLNVF